MQLAGHRGARGEAPENTLGGFTHLKTLPVKAVEFDVRQLKDGQLVVIHDNDLYRTTGHDFHLSQFNLDQLQYFSHTKQWQNWQNKELTPTLLETLKLLTDFEHIELEVKSVNSSEAAQKLVNALVPIITPYLNQITVTSFDEKILNALKSNNDIKKGLLIDKKMPFSELYQKLTQHKCTRVGIKESLITEEMVKSLKQFGYLVTAWTVNNTVRAQQLQNWQIDTLITDYPTKMLAELKL